MEQFRLLILEDKGETIEDYIKDIEIYSKQVSRTFDIVPKKTLSETLKTLDDSFDGVIIDVRLEENGIEGLILSPHGIEGVIFQGETFTVREPDDSVAKIQTSDDGDIKIILSDKEIELDTSDDESVYSDIKLAKEGQFAIKLSSTKLAHVQLAFQEAAGKFIYKILRERYRIPVVFYTATPINIDTDSNYIGAYTKDKKSITDILVELLVVYDTGITKIMGGRGHIEQAMQKIFWENIIPQLDTWKLHAKNGKQTEKALLRFTLNHLIDLLEEDGEFCFTEEMYIAPPISSNIKTGGIVKKKAEEEFYIIMSPTCDLAIRQDGTCKTNNYLFCRIEDFGQINTQVLNGIIRQSKKEKKLRTLLANNHTNYYHWLPGGHEFPGGIINFRQCMTVTKDDFSSSFEGPIIQVSMHFVKDIVARFSSYYARQGQPDFDCENIAKKMLLD